jgi:hypothetical protein
MPCLAPPFFPFRRPEDNKTPNFKDGTPWDVVAVLNTNLSRLSPDSAAAKALAKYRADVSTKLADWPRRTSAQAKAVVITPSLSLVLRYFRREATTGEVPGPLEIEHGTIVGEDRDVVVKRILVSHYAYECMRVLLMQIRVMEERDQGRDVWPGLGSGIPAIARLHSLLCMPAHWYYQNVVPPGTTAEEWRKQWQAGFETPEKWFGRLREDEFLVEMMDGPELNELVNELIRGARQTDEEASAHTAQVLHLQRMVEESLAKGGLVTAQVKARVSELYKLTLKGKDSREQSGNGTGATGARPAPPASRIPRAVRSDRPVDGVVSGGAK